MWLALMVPMMSSSIGNGEIDAGALQPVAEMATQAAIQADLIHQDWQHRQTREAVHRYGSAHPRKRLPVQALPPTATHLPAPGRCCTAADKLICVIVPPVENPFFGSLQEIAAKKAEELGYTRSNSSMTTMPTSRGTVESCIARKRRDHPRQRWRGCDCRRCSESQGCGHPHLPH